jgi:phosphomethylpyrimidine synthase
MKDTIPTISTGGLPASRKVYAAGDQHEIRVPMREIAVSGVPFPGKTR